MWQSIAAFLASSKVLATLLDNVLKQGFSVLLLIAAIAWMRYELQLQRNALSIMEVKVEQCSQDLITYYREDRIRTEEVLQDATDIMTKLSKKLDNE